MDGCNNMKVSAAYRFDAIQPTVLQVGARALRCMYIHFAAANMHIARSKACSSCIKLALLQQALCAAALVSEPQA